MAYKTDYTLLEQVIQMLAANKDNKFSRVIETVVNEAMKLERTQALQAEPYERTDERTGYANGFKNKTLALATGKVQLKIPQVRGLEFYPSCIEKGIRSERSLKLAIAEMYVKGVSTRRVSDIVEILCGTEVSSSQVSRLAKEIGRFDSDKKYLLVVYLKHFLFNVITTLSRYSLDFNSDIKKLKKEIDYRQFTFKNIVYMIRVEPKIGLSLLLFKLSPTAFRAFARFWYRNQLA